MPTIRTILPQVKNSEVPLLRVAAYCRVSSDSDDQLHSFGVQTDYYTKLIDENPLWTLVDIYADEGITGTSMKKRDDFNRMIADCKKGKIDRILTKSVSRFARNTVDCLETVRLLSGLGISILFEKEQIDTANMSSEVMLSFMSTQAQDESVSISGNMLWSYEKRMKNGSFLGCKAPYGYRLINGHLVIHDKEADTVRWIFRQYLSGHGASSIADALNARDMVEENRSAPWRVFTVQHILKNERYMGDALLQKTMTIGGVAHKKVNNKGEQTQYYVENSHPAIVSREDFMAVQDALKKYQQGKRRPNRKYAGLLKCPACGCAFTRLNTGYWVCGSRKRLGYDCPRISIDEDSLSLAIDRVLRTIDENPVLIGETVKYLDRLQQVSSKSQEKIKEIDRSIAETNAQLMVLMSLQTQGILDAADFVDQNRGLTEQISRLRSERRALLQAGDDETIDQLEDLQEAAGDVRKDLQNCEYDMLKTVIDYILVTGNEALEIHLRGGLVLPEGLPIIKRRCQRG